MHRITIHTPSVASGLVEFDCKAGRSLLSAAYKAKVEFPIACKNAVCEICRAQLLEGEVIQKLGVSERLVTAKQSSITPISELLSEPSDDTANTEKAAKLKQLKQCFNQQNNGILDEDNQVLLCRVFPQSDISLYMNKVATATQRPIVQHACQVVEVSPLTTDTYQVELLAPAGQTLDYLAGQYLELHLDIDSEGQPLYYSIANATDADQPRRLQLFIQNASELAADIIKKLEELADNNSTVKVTLPMGEAFLQTPLDLTHVLIAAGSGISQVKCLTEEILKQQPDADVEIYWSNKNVDDFYLFDEFQNWLEQHENLNFTPILESVDADWPGRSGYIYEVVMEDFEDLEGAQVYLCGSPQMVYGTIDNLKEIGLNEKECFSDVFAYAPRS